MNPQPHEHPRSSASRPSLLPLGVMALKCTVCQHVSRDAIERSLIHGEPMRDVAGRYSLSKSALHRHRNAHLPKALAKAQEAEEIVRADSLLGEVEALMARTDTIYSECVAAGDMRLALSAIREKRGCLELLGKATGELDRPEPRHDPRPMFSLPEGSYPRVTVEVEKDDAIDITPSPAGD